MIRRLLDFFSTPTAEPVRDQSHGQLIEQVLKDHEKNFDHHPVFIEVGSGITSITLANAARRSSASIYSLDYNQEKIDDLKSRVGEKLNNIEFIVGDSLDNLPTLVDKHPRIDFVFLDSAASAMHTFREFMIIEPAFHTGSCVVVDNAALPGEEITLSPVRKGKILVPYLLASPLWAVSAHPRSGDSMVSAVLCEEPDYADPAFEDPEYIDSWKALFDSEAP